MAEVQKEILPVELDRSDIIYEFPNRFIHKMTMRYPKDNIINMKKSWEKLIEEGEEWLENYEKTVAQIISQGNRNLEDSANKTKKEHEAFMKLSKEEQYEKLIKTFNEQKKQNEEFIKDLDKHKEDLRNNIKEEYKKYKIDIEKKVKSRKDALKMWNKTIKR